MNIASTTKPSSSSSSSSSSSRPTVAVIGGGPGAMFLCHALETQKKEMESKGEDTSAFPIVKVFERAEGPGGVWRADRSHETGDSISLDDIAEEKKDDNDERMRKPKVRKIDKPTPNTSTNMYAALWTNGPKESFEFYDYTFKDHFGDVRMPIHLPRKYVLKYIVARVTRNCSDFFQRYFNFRTTVRKVRYLEDTQKFRVCTFNETTKEEQVELFDKCIWAAGINGIQKIPKPTLERLEKGGFPGRMMHSSDTSTFKEDVEGKTILMIGGEYSAEDLALMAIKEGASKIYIMARYKESAASENSRYPYDKVEVIEEFDIDSVKGGDITLKKVYYDLKKKKYIFDGDEERVLHNIDTVVFCTGYEKNLSMLDPALRNALAFKEPLSFPNDWTPREDKYSQTFLGDYFLKMRPKKNEVVSCDYYEIGDNLYQETFCIDNPSMMYILGRAHQVPLLNCEVKGWMIAKVLSNQIPLPSAEKMREENLETVGEMLQRNSVRYEMDWEYREEIDEANEDDEGGKPKMSDPEDVTYWLFGKQMLQFKYPISYINNEDAKNIEDVEWSEYSDCMDVIHDADDAHRNDLDKVVYDTKKEKDGWMTFRDNFRSGETKSFFTGISPIPLPKPWHELHEDDALW